MCPSRSHVDRAALQQSGASESKLSNTFYPFGLRALTHCHSILDFSSRVILATPKLPKNPHRDVCGNGPRHLFPMRVTVNSQLSPCAMIPFFECRNARHVQHVTQLWWWWWCGAFKNGKWAACLLQQQLASASADSPRKTAGERNTVCAAIFLPTRRCSQEPSAFVTHFNGAFCVLRGRSSRAPAAI